MERVGKGSSLNGQGGSSAPDVLVVVLDCVRSSDFPGGAEAVTGTPFLDGLRQESVIFPRAVSTSPWTVPSHASLLTGLYPWEHRAHGKAQLKLQASVPRLPASLKEKGYATASISANALLSPDMGWTDGFDVAYAGGFLQDHLRLTPAAPPPEPFGVPQTRRSLHQEVTEGPLAPIMGLASQLSLRMPFLLDGLHRIGGGLRRGGSSGVAPWIEGLYRSWVGKIPRSTPTFAFINLLDAHEPYLTSREFAPGLRAWWRYAHVRQDRSAFLAGRWVPTPEELGLLHEMYRQTLRSLDGRLRALTDVLRATGRWDNALLVITSDHGQSFGEDHMLFHLHHVGDSVLRVPLWVRFPRGEPGGTLAEGWASGIDVPKTIFEVTGALGRPSAEARDLRSLIEEERPEPALAMSDGIVWPVQRLRVPPARRGLYDRVLLAGYAPRTKGVMDCETGALTLHQLPPGPAGPATAPSTPEVGAEAATLREHLLAVRSALNLGQGRSSDAWGVDRRLRGWGYD